MVTFEGKKSKDDEPKINLDEIDEALKKESAGGKGFDEKFMNFKQKREVGFVLRASRYLWNFHSPIGDWAQTFRRLAHKSLSNTEKLRRMTKYFFDLIVIGSWKWAIIMPVWGMWLEKIYGFKILGRNFYGERWEKERKGKEEREEMPPLGWWLGPFLPVISFSLCHLFNWFVWWVKGGNLFWPYSRNNSHVKVVFQIAIFDQLRWYFNGLRRFFLFFFWDARNAMMIDPFNTFLRSNAVVCRFDTFF